MAKDTQSRKWQITINNPTEKGYTHEKIKEQLGLFSKMVYWCICDEIGENNTYHTHIYFALEKATRFSTVKNRFDGGHYEMAKGTSHQNREYIRKEGKWEKDKKKETNLAETFEEFGECPVERQGQRNDLHDLYDMIKDGMTNYEIMEIEPNYMMNLDKIERARQIIKEEKYKNTFRIMNVKYISGKTGVGKTRGVMEKYNYVDVFRVTDYKNPFDNYKGQHAIIFEEFRSSLRIQDMLNYLDGYPLELPCRYNNKIACYTDVYIITNIPLEKQYEEIQKNYIETWQAFLRRINQVVNMQEKKSDIYTVEEYMSRENEFIKIEEEEKENLPFI